MPPADGPDEYARDDDDPQRTAPEDDGRGDPRAHVASADAVDWTDRSPHEGYAVRRKQLGAAAGGEDLGCSLYELPPGNRSWPYHYHEANAEAVYVLDGEGVLRTPAGETTLSPGDYAAFPTGDAGAHQLRVPADADGPLRYFALSTMVEPDVCVYPDSGKVGVFGGAPPGGDRDERTVSGYFPLDAAVDYWEGEVEANGPDGR